MKTVEKIIVVIVVIQAIRSLIQLQYDTLSVLDYGVLISSILALIAIGAYDWREHHE